MRKFPRNPIDYDHNLRVEFHSNTPSRQITDAVNRPKSKILIISESIDLDFWMKHLHHVSHTVYLVYLHSSSLVS